MHLTNSGPVIAESDIADFERRIGISLPKGYRRFLLEVNGGYGLADRRSGQPPDSYNSLSLCGTAFSDADIVAADRDPARYSDERYLRDLEFISKRLWHAGLPRNWLPIGATGFENLLLIHLADGSVWRMDTGRGDFDHDNCTKIVGSFEELDLKRA